MADMQRNRDLVLPPRTQAFVLDTTKGKISTYVGPSKTSLSDTDQLVSWDGYRRQFTPCNDTAKAVQNWAEAAEGQYIVLRDPSKDTSRPHPSKDTSDVMIELDVGRTEIIPGPITFPLWAGQTAETINGHRIATNQYIVVRVSQLVDARNNWKGRNECEASEFLCNYNELVMGKLFIIKGTDVSFYIPTTGFEVVGDKDGNYVRNAVTLEQLEYSILLDENGKKRYVHGPSVVFPEPTEVFITQDNARKFQAIELSPTSGIYVKVTVAYEENEKQYNVGDELFITGNEMPFYFPRAEHNVIKYGDKIKHHAIAIPEGEGRYVLNRKTGEVKLVKGAKMYLPNPINEVVVKRVLDPETVKVMYPGNVTAVQVNEQYTAEAANEQFLYQTQSGALFSAQSLSCSTARHEPNNLCEQVSRMFGDRTQDRGTTYSMPRTITLDTKYEGAVAIDVWAGYAVCVMDKRGNRRVELGPKTILLEYDESLAVLELSTGSPKNHEKLTKTCYLRVYNNTVSDVVVVDTSDFVSVSVKLSYKVNFVADHEREENARGMEKLWFETENYVKLLTEHCRSRLRGIVKQHTINSFYGNAVEVIRDALLGEKKEDADRQGLLFESNCMLLMDVDVLNVTIENSNVAQLFNQTTFDTLTDAVNAVREQCRSRHTATLENLKRVKQLEYRQTIAEELKTKLEELRAEQAVDQAETNHRLYLLDEAAKDAEKRRAIEKATADMRLEIDEAQNKVTLDFMKTETALKAQLLEAITPKMIASLEAFGDKNFVTTLTEALAPAALAAGVTTADLLSRIFGNTPFGEILGTLAQRNPCLLGDEIPLEKPSTFAQPSI